MGSPTQLRGVARRHGVLQRQQARFGVGREQGDDFAETIPLPNEYSASACSSALVQASRRLASSTVRGGSHTSSSVRNCGWCSGFDADVVHPACRQALRCSSDEAVVQAMMGTRRTRPAARGRTVTSAPWASAISLSTRIRSNGCRQCRSNASVALATLSAL